MSWHQGEWAQENRAACQKVLTGFGTGDLWRPGCTPGAAPMPHPKHRTAVDPDTSVLGVTGGHGGVMPTGGSHLALYRGPSTGLRDCGLRGLRGVKGVGDAA